VAKKTKKKSAAAKGSTSRRRVKAKRKSPARRARRLSAPVPAGLDLKELKAQLEATVRALSTGTAIPAAGAYEAQDFARARLADWMSSIDEICDRGGCGPDMVFPPLP
jgi:hypothetical protein